MSTFRILPVVVLSLVITFAMRAVELWTGTAAIAPAYASDASAAHAAPTGETGAVKPAAEDASARETPAAPEALPAVPTPTMLPPSGADAPKDKNIPALTQPQAASQVALAEPKPAAPAASPAIQRPKIPGEGDFMSASEIEVLESLTKRREDLDKRAAELDMREKLLIATEQRLGQKLAEIKAVESQVNSVVHTLDENQAKQIASLVKVYENMKPKDAANIMQDLDKNILLEVAARMKEAKMAPILAAMEPSKAREVTVLLAKRNEIPGREG